MKTYIFALVCLVTIPSLAKAETNCELSSGLPGKLLVVQYTLPLQGSFREQKEKFAEILEGQFDKGSVFELVDGSASVSATTAHVCASTKFRPLLLAELLNRAGFRIANDDREVDPTR